MDMEIDTASDSEGSAADTADATKEERLKTALWSSLGRLVDSTCLTLSSSSSSKNTQSENAPVESDGKRMTVNATPQFIAALTELVHAQIKGVGSEVEMFARHANRTTVQTPDVLLLARKNPDLEGVLQGEAEGFRKTRGGALGGGRGRGAGGGGGSAAARARGRGR